MSNPSSSYYVPSYPSSTSTVPVTGQPNGMTTQPYYPASTTLPSQYNPSYHSVYNQYGLVNSYTNQAYPHVGGQTQAAYGVPQGAGYGYYDMNGYSYPTNAMAMGAWGMNQYQQHLGTGATGTNYYPQQLTPQASALSAYYNSAPADPYRPVQAQPANNSNRRTKDVSSSVKLANTNTQTPSTSTTPVTTTSDSITAQTWSCEPCDKTFTSETAYTAHCATHECCSEPGCEFRASRKVLSAHFQSVHGQYAGTGYKEIEVEGQKFQVLLGMSPEEVTEWRNERKKRFPTANRVEEKKRVTEELQSAGGVVGDEKRRKLNPQNEATADNSENSNKQKIPRNVCRAYLRGMCKRGTRCRFVHNPEYLSEEVANGAQLPREKKTSDTKNSQRSNSKLIIPEPLSGGARGTLLRKLLEDEVHSEENSLLQCVRFLYHFIVLPQSVKSVPSV